MDISSADRVEELARQARERVDLAAAQARQAQQIAGDRRAEQHAHASKAAKHLHGRLARLSSDLRRRVGLYLEYHASGDVPLIVLAVSQLPPWAQRPYLRVLIEPHLDDRSSASPDGERFTISPYVYNGHPSRTVTEEALIAEVEQACAAFINDRASFAFHAPDWYWVAGSLIAWPLAVLTFALFALVGGWIGAVIGFFVGWIVKAIARPLWLPAVCAIGAWAILWPGR